MPVEYPKQEQFPLGMVLSMVLLCFLLADSGLRMLPAKLVTFRAAEALQRYPAPNAPFEANQHYEQDHAYGDLSALGNLPLLRQYRKETFTTDKFGCRNLPNAAAKTPDVIVFGDSYGAGFGLQDEDTLAAQISAQSGKVVYNAAGYYPTLITHVLSVAKKMGMRRGLVIYEHSERVLEPVPKLNDADGLSDEEPEDMLLTFISKVSGFWCFSPLEIFLSRAYKTILNDQVLPNPFASNVVQMNTTTGDALLFLPEELSKSDRKDEQQAAPKFFARLAKTLKARGLELLVVLVPNKYTVYEPLLQKESDTGLISGRYFAGLEKNLRQEGVAVSNLTSIFRQNARTGLEHGSLLYWKDDTHWNRVGVELAARQIVQQTGLGVTDAFGDK